MSKVLIIDDEPDIHEILDVHLKRKGIDVEHALTGEEGVEMYKKMFESNDLPDLVVMDLNLSGSRGMDGIELHKEGKGKRIDAENNGNEPRCGHMGLHRMVRYRMVGKVEGCRGKEDSEAAGALQGVC